jgi:tetratricopeptide (TPR) repeat protein
LQFHPHDKESHKQLIFLLEKKYAFRPIAVEDASWVWNNPSDCWFDLIQLVSYSRGALHDPEFAIGQLGSYLASISRQDDRDDYDDFEDQLASLLEERNRLEEALPLLAELVRLNPKEAGFWLDYGDALSAAGRHPEAIQALHRSMDLNPSMEVTHERLAEVLLRIGDLEGAATEYRAYLSIYDNQYKAGAPTDSYHSMVRDMLKYSAAHHEETVLAETRLKLAHVLFLAKKYDDAIAQTDAALNADHNEFAAFYLRAQIYDAEADHAFANRTREMATVAIQKEAAKEFSKSGKKPDIDPRLLFLSDSLWNEKPGSPAFPSEILAILEPRAATLSVAEQVVLAEAYFALTRTGDAKVTWEKAIAADPTVDNAVAHANLGARLFKAGALREALPHLQRAYELDPQNVTYRMDYETTKKMVAN